MASGSPSQASTPAGAEEAATYQLTLVAGEEIRLPIKLREFDRLAEFENSVLECLSAVSAIDAFGCELDFVNLDTQVILSDPIWDTLRECDRFSLVVRQRFVRAEHKGQLRQRSPRAIRIPADDTGFVLRHAFSHVPDLRHVQVEEGTHTVGASAWQSCQQLQIVKLCYALMEVLVPGCIRFGRRVFAECCSLYHVGTTEEATNLLAPDAQISPYAFESCLALSQVSFEQAGARASLMARYIPEGSFCGSGLEQLKLPGDFNFVGPIACENCKRLRLVDLTGTKITAIWGSTFSHCVNLVQIWFPRKLRRIGKEAFLLCSSLQEVYTPPALLYIAHRAFFDCEQLTQFTKMEEKITWRGPYAESNTFALCAKFHTPEWINMLPPDGEDSQAFNPADFDEELRRSLH